MNPSYACKIVGEAYIANYNVGFSQVTYAVCVTNASLEAEILLTSIPDFTTAFTQVFKEEKGRDVFQWLDTPAASLLQKSWAEKEENCFFEKIKGTHSALMTLTGIAILIPLPMNNFFESFGEK